MQATFLPALERIDKAGGGDDVKGLGNFTRVSWGGGQMAAVWAAMLL